MARKLYHPARHRVALAATAALSMMAGTQATPVVVNTVITLSTSVGIASAPSSTCSGGLPGSASADCVNRMVVSDENAVVRSRTSRLSISE